MPVDGAPDEELRESLQHLVTESRKARVLNNDLRVAALHCTMNDLLDELLERRRHVTLGTV